MEGTDAAASALKTWARPDTENPLLPEIQNGLLNSPKFSRPTIVMMLNLPAADLFYAIVLNKVLPVKSAVRTGLHIQ
ncbi:hypothetical protein [Micavibrio aeruginosavorus]|uniref:hypothetical protein n=1 Tax=Micavibrio aeruginosavorus TaxID=349221 RepID=UPI0011D287B0|nr:hypothetical protein [Micavibrio aeruginosavorus]